MQVWNIYLHYVKASKQNITAKKQWSLNIGKTIWKFYDRRDTVNGILWLEHMLLAATMLALGKSMGLEAAMSALEISMELEGAMLALKTGMVWA